MLSISKQFAFWYLTKVPKKIFRGWKNFLRFVPRYFSMGLLLKTFFAPWRSYTWKYKRGFYLGQWLKTLFSNLLTRIIGAFARALFIGLGLVAETAVFFSGAVLMILWLVLPFLLIKSFLHGFQAL